MAGSKSIHTTRLELVPATVPLLEADVQRSDYLATQLKASIPPDWPPSELAEVLPYFLQALQRDPDLDRWWMYYWVAKGSEEAPRALIGSGGFRGEPTEDGTVEIGYGVLASHQRRGYATEAVRAMAAHAFRERRVKRIVADTMTDNQASIHVLEKIGFRCIGEGAEAGTIRFELTRTRHAAPSSA